MPVWFAGWTGIRELAGSPVVTLRGRDRLQPTMNVGVCVLISVVPDYVAVRLLREVSSLAFYLGGHETPLTLLGDVTRERRMVVAARRCMNLLGALSPVTWGMVVWLARMADPEHVEELPISGVSGSRRRRSLPITSLTRESCRPAVRLAQGAADCEHDVACG